jgi:hypothetical protein
MKKIYNNYISLIQRFLEANQYFKMLITEKYALWRKKGFVKKVIWSDHEEKEFVQFWSEHYKKIGSSGSKLFQYFNGVFRKDYIPDYLYATKLESMFNPYKYSQIYSDKSLIEIFYKSRSKAIIPQTYLLNANGILYDYSRKVIGLEQAEGILLSLNKAVIKPIIGGNSGNGVTIGHFDDDGYDSENKYSILSLLQEENKNYIVQEIVEQSESLNNLYPDAINTFRVITYIANSKVNVAPLSLRMGTGGNKVDNIHSGGLVIGIHLLGSKASLYPSAFKLGYSDKKEIFSHHPDTNIEFNGYGIDGVQDIYESAKVLHGFSPHIGMISWDFTLDINNTPVLIEANFIGQSVWFPQIVTGKPIFGDDAEYILNKIK